MSIYNFNQPKSRPNPINGAVTIPHSLPMTIIEFANKWKLWDYTFREVVIEYNKYLKTN